MRIPPLCCTASCLALLLTACSNLPARGLLSEVEFRVAATYEFAGHPPSAVQVPASRGDLMVLELSTEPEGLRESFQDGKRFLLLPDDCRVLHLRCHYRLFGYEQDSPDLPGPAQLFPGATKLATF